MKKIKLITDSTSDIPPDLAKKLNIDVLPIPIVIDHVGYYEGVDFTPKDFYKILVSRKDIPTTSQITSPILLETFIKYYEMGYARVVHVPVNSKGSNTYNSSLIARELFFEEYPSAHERFDIIIIDAKSYSLGYGLPVLIAAEMLEEGKNPYEIINFLENAHEKTHLFFSIFSLEFAKKSGRIRASAAFVGDVLGLRPLMTIKDGEIIIPDKIRGDTKVIEKMVAKAKGSIKPNTAYKYALLVADIDSDMMDILKKTAKKELGGAPHGIYDIGASVTINSGPKVCGVVVTEI